MTLIDMKKYILDENDEPVEEPDLLKWADWINLFGHSRLMVARETLKYPKMEVSTVFLGLDHRIPFPEPSDPLAPPIVWETMVFGGPLDGEMDRCSGNRCSALEMHYRMVVRAREHLISPYRIVAAVKGLLG